MRDITRIETDPRRSRAVVYNGVVYVGGMTAEDRSLDIAGQTKQTLEKIEGYLEKAGTDKSRILTAQIWIKDLERDFAAMNEVWNAWVPEGHAPARACGEAKLAAPKYLVEVIVVAAC